MARTKSFTYRTSIEWKEGIAAELASEGKPTITISTPPEFKGLEGRWTPENLYVASIESCLLYTFIALARSRELDYAAYSSTAEGLLETVEGQMVVSTVTVRPRIVIKNETDREKAEGIVGRLEPNCFISNSVESEVIIEAEIVIAEAAKSKAAKTGD